MSCEINQQKEKAMAFFAKGESLAGTGNYDYAIEMYLEGLKADPDALEKGHMALHKLALRRQVKGGKKPTMMEKVKHMRGKDPLEQLVNAQYLFSKDPDNLSYAEAILKACVAGGYSKTAKWMADVVFGANSAQNKPSFHTYVLLKDAYNSIGAYERALMACKKASELKPDDRDLADEFKRLTAELTVSKGNYGQGGNFRDSIKDREGQELLQSQSGVSKSDNYRDLAVKNARAAYAKDPDSSKNVFNLASALMDIQDDEHEKEAILLLEKTSRRLKDFGYQQRAGEYKIRFLKRKLREAKKFYEHNSSNAKAKSNVVGLGKLLKKAELVHYQHCVENYPTDLAMKYEYGVRLVENGEYDEAIGYLQDAQRDPRHKIRAMNQIGLCFLKKQWYADAIDVLIQAIEETEIKDDAIGKELRYNLGCSYQYQGEKEKALDIFRKIAQLDFGYKDVRQRVSELRQ